MANREDVVKGLHELADFLAANEQVPLPSMYFNVFVSTKEELKEIATAAPSWSKRFGLNFVSLAKEFSGGVNLEVNIPREQVCTKVVTGTRVVPAREEYTEEVYEWKCDDAILMGE